MVRGRTAVIDCARLEPQHRNPTRTPGWPARRDRSGADAGAAVIFVDHADVLSAVDDRAALASLVDETYPAPITGLVITARDRELVDDLIRVPVPPPDPGLGAGPGRQPPELSSYEAFEGRRTDMWKLERARDPKITWVSLLGLILVPLLVSGGFLWATWNSDSRLDRVQAAIVNNDERDHAERPVRAARTAAGRWPGERRGRRGQLRLGADRRRGRPAGLAERHVRGGGHHPDGLLEAGHVVQQGRGVADRAGGDPGADLRDQRDHRRRGRAGDHHRGPRHAEHRADRAVPGQHLPRLQRHQEAVPVRWPRVRASLPTAPAG